MTDHLAGRLAIKARQVRPGQAHAVEVKAGQLVQVTDVRGKQVADFVAFRRDDRAERLSVAATRGASENLMLQQGMEILSNRRTPMFELIEDKVGRHDMLFAACDPVRYEKMGELGHPSCKAALTQALARSTSPRIRSRTRSTGS